MQDRHGRLPALLLILTVVTGLVDAVSYLKLGHAFVANMTGNVVFLGFALAGAAGLSAPASLVALAAFLAGALVGGRLGTSMSDHRGHLLARAATLKVVLVGVAAAIAFGHQQFDVVTTYTVIVLLAFAMGIQNATVRNVGVPDLTTTVLTLTLTGLAADSKVAGGASTRWVRRVLSILAMLLGALVGALLVFKASVTAALPRRGAAGDHGTARLPFLRAAGGLDGTGAMIVCERSLRQLLLGGVLAVLIMPNRAVGEVAASPQPLQSPAAEQPAAPLQMAPDDYLIAQAWAQGNLAVVITVADRQLRVAPGDNFARTLRGAAHFNLNHYDAAIADETLVLLGTQSVLMALQIRGASYFQRGQYVDAIDDETRALELRPTAFSYGYRGAAKFWSNDSKGAITDLTAALAIAPDDEWALATRGAAKVDVDDYRAGLDDENAALKLAPADSYAKSIRGAARYYLGDVKGAIEDENVVLGEGPNGYAFSIRGLAEIATGDYVRAVRDERAAIANDYATPFTYEVLGDALSLLGRYPDAVKAYDLALKGNHDPDLRKKRDQARAKAQ